MRSFSLPLLLSFIALPTELIGAVRFDLHGRAAPRLLDKRTAITGASALTDTNNLLYYLNLTLGGSQFQVAIDTGSADLWVAGNVTNSQDTGKTRTVQYVGEEATGEAGPRSLSCGTGSYSQSCQVPLNLPHWIF
ncbi:uncharacterized protein FIBRA_08921 [Fibroporia radiculosa]|uniref:Peptidase A1 domain-containing protein n=1 Tax=Fibroporia radiculosa TaxID=599839 RepID=J4GXM5_9APHY|nr:uncharacterized protein FIBRA_08921 [Fibroporia radiculosa]CCM06640.1 predicted protein [Fibroporia radiculosa]